MKIENEYDLMSKICESKQGFDMNQKALKNLKLSTVLYSFYTAFDIATNSFDPTTTLINYTMCNAIFNAMDLCIFIPLSKYDNMELARTELHTLVRKLSALNIDTGIEMLKEATVSQVNYKLTINEKKLPIIKQQKYILIPTYSEFKIDATESILQEHTMGSKKWILSKGSPKKLTKRRLAFNM